MLCITALRYSCFFSAFFIIVKASALDDFVSESPVISGLQSPLNMGCSDLQCPEFEAEMQFFILEIAAFLLPLCYAHIAEYSSQGVGRNKIFQNKGEGRRALRPALSIRTAPDDLVELVAGQSTAMECEAGGTPPPAVYWTKDGRRIAQNMHESLHPYEGAGASVRSVLGLGFTRSRLFIDCASSSDAGTYECVAETEHMHERKASKVSIVDPAGEGDATCLSEKNFASPARAHMWTHTRLEVMGADVQLFCRAGGTPQPQVSWLAPDGKPLTDSSKYRILDNGDLIIRKISWLDMGGYICQVKNSEGSDESSVFLYPTLPDNNVKA